MSSELLDNPTTISEPPPRSALRAEPASACPAVAAWSPAVAALVAFGVHELLPDAQVPLLGLPGAAVSHPYAILLAVVVALSVLAAGGQYFLHQLRPAVSHYAPLVAAAVAATCLWELVTVKFAWLPLPYFPGPEMVLTGMINDRDILLDSAYRSLKLLLCGYAIGVAAGLTSGILMGWFRRVRYWGMPVLKVLGPIPATAFVPLAMVMFSNSFLAGAALIALAVWFPVTMLTTSGIANVPAAYFEVARTLGARRGYLIFRVALPAASPSVFIGLFMGLGASFLTLIVAETIGVKSGLGWYLKWQQGYAEYANVYAAIVIMAVFFSTLMTALFKLRDWMLGWQKGLIRW